ncbi:MAG: hypothetical protein KIS65_03375, partial [Nitrosomonas sp.]|nr:hypothetical protein [Nitrosomonas sp.]
MNERKNILDSCCGARTIWFDRGHPDTVFGDKKIETVTVNTNPLLIKCLVQTDLKPATGRVKAVWRLHNRHHRKRTKDAQQRSAGGFNDF